MSPPKKGLLGILFQLLFPMKCPVCGKVPLQGEPVCMACMEQTKNQEVWRRYQIKTGDFLEEFICKAPCRYEEPAKKVLHRFKFQGKTAYAYSFALLMAQAAEIPEREYDGLVFVPMVPKKEKARGYNQARLLAEEMGKRMALPVMPLLEKQRDIQLQHTLKKQERLENVKNAFTAKSGAKGMRLLLVDDVLTTGATLRECATTLYLAGATQVTGIAAASAAQHATEPANRFPDGTAVL